MFMKKSLKDKHCLVTGAAGFIGSHLTRRLLAEGCTVTAIDCFTDYYDLKIKESNISDLMSEQSFKLIRKDIASIGELKLAGIDLIFHQAAQAGVRASWGNDFALYTHHNILGTQRLLEWARYNKVEKLIYASSSSVYGNIAKLPMHEDDLPRPISPYGVTKLAAEHLCNLYHYNFAVPTVSLRYFTVYGPCQRPDMAFQKFIKSILAGEEVVIYGDGEQTRDFTYIDDIVEVNIAAAQEEVKAGRVYNIGGGSRININGVLEKLEKLSGKTVNVRYEQVQAGDPLHTFADTTKAEKDLHYRPATKIEEGLRSMLATY